jgi:DNA-binding CsgD family transcriptional regulator
LRIALVVDKDCWGTVAAYRGTDYAPYTSDEVALARAVAPLLGVGLRLSLLKVAARTSRAGEAPGWLLLDPANQLIGSTPAGDRWLGELAPTGQLPVALASLANAVRRGTSQPRVQVPARSGGWLSVHGSVAKGLEQGNVALIIEPEQRAGVAPELCAAYSLTRREQDVLGAVLRGSSTKQIAAELGISGWTVRDHVRAVFAKVGVQSRPELAARIYDRHISPRSREDASLGPNGWFLDGPTSARP